MSRAIVLHSDIRAGVRMLNREQAGTLLLALCAWADGEEPVIEDATMRPFWGLVKAKQEEYALRYEDKCRKLANNRKGKTKSNVTISDQLKSIDDKSGETKTKTKTKTKGIRDTGTVASTVQQPSLLELKAGEIESIRWDRERKVIDGIGEKDVGVWQSAYPLVDVTAEVERAGLWLRENPRRMKRDVRKFLGGWLRRAQGYAEERGQRTEDGGRRTGPTRYARGASEPVEPRVNQGGLLA